MMSMTSPYARPRLPAIVHSPRGKLVSVSSPPIAVIAPKTTRKIRVDFVLGVTTRNSPATFQTCSGISATILPDRPRIEPSLNAASNGGPIPTILGLWDRLSLDRPPYRLMGASGGTEAPGNR